MTPRLPHLRPLHLCIRIAMTCRSRWRDLLANQWQEKAGLVPKRNRNRTIEIDKVIRGVRRLMLSTQHEVFLTRADSWLLSAIRMVDYLLVGREGTVWQHLMGVITADNGHLMDCQHRHKQITYDPFKTWIPAIINRLLKGNSRQINF